MKILSICIPSYNMEEYLPVCVDSLIVPSVSKIEIIIVNDGSSDRTLDIANEYKSKYPDSIVVIDKKNGHYGSTVNAALKIATGKYFRILDADDWIDSDVLEYFIARLENIDSDCIYTKFTLHNVLDGAVETKTVSNLPMETLLDLDQYQLPDDMFAMHSLTYRLSFLREIGFHQTEGICFTDIEYVMYPLSEAKTMYALDCSLYQYLIGREGQSVSFASMLKTIDHRLKIVNRILDEWNTNRKRRNYKHMRYTVITSLMQRVFRVYLLHSKYDDTIDTTAYDIMNKIKGINSVLFASIMQTKSLVLVPHVRIWYNYRKSSFKWLNAVGDILKFLGMR